MSPSPCGQTVRCLLDDSQHLEPVFHLMDGLMQSAGYHVGRTEWSPLLLVEMLDFQRRRLQIPAPVGVSRIV